MALSHFLLGISAGAAHTFAAPDHLAALVPLAVQSRRKAISVGVVWGLGHGVGVLVLGFFGVWIQSYFSIEALLEAAEVLIGILIAILGVNALRHGRKIALHTSPATAIHMHTDVEQACDHDHSNTSGWALGVGILHGFAAGTVIALVPGLTGDMVSAGMFLLGYTLASVVTMAGFAWGVGQFAAKMQTKMLLATVYVVGGGSVLFGVGWVVAALY
jgi:hypothetical protein